MIIFLYGLDAYRLKQTKANIVDRYKAKHSSGVNLFYFDLSETNNLDSLENAIKSTSFFNEHKLLVCNNLFSNKATANTMAEYVNMHGLSNASDIILMAVENFSEKDLVLKHKELFKLLSGKNGMVKNIEGLEGVKLSEWILNEFHSRECSISQNALKNLTAIIGNDSWTLINEIEKLCTYKKGENIVIADINLLTVPKVDLNIFDLIDALGVRNNKKAFELLYRELKTGRDPYYILTRITYQFRNLLMIKDLQTIGYSQAEIAKKASIHPFVIKKALKNPFNYKEIIRTYGDLLAIDTGFKRGDLDLEDSLYSLSLS